MSLTDLHSQYQDDLAKVDSQIESITGELSQDAFLKDPVFVKHVQSLQRPEAQHVLESLSLTQLNEKSRQIDHDVASVKKLLEVSARLTEIASIVSKEKTLADLLEFQHLFTLFKNIRSSDFDPSVAIYKSVSKRVDELYEEFLTQLNHFLVLLLPDPNHIMSVSILSDFNSLLTKNEIRLNHYTQLRSSWDQIIDDLLGDKTVSIDIDEDDIDSISLLIEARSSQSFLRSLYNLVTFINYVGSTPIKNYLNSKIKNRLIEKVTANISSINQDQQKIEDLGNLSELCHSTDWTFLSQLDNFGDSSIKDNLDKLYVDWLIDGYVERIRQVFAETQIQGSKYWKPESISESKVAQAKEEPQEADHEDGWDDGWDDNWDIDDDDAQKKEEPEAEKVSKQSGLSDIPNGPDWIQISNLPIALTPIFEEFRKVSDDVSYLITMFKALSLSKYPPLSKSFLLFDDLTYLSKTLGIEDFEKNSVSLWNQTMIQFYQELKLLIVSLDLNSLDVSANGTPVPDDDDYDDFVLDDYNLNQLSVVYKWFNGLCQDAEFEQNNAAKFKQLILTLVNFINNWLIGSIISISEITEYQSKKIGTLVDSLDNVTLPFVMQVGEKRDTVKSYSKLANVKFLIQNHLKDIMDRFYQGELFDVSTEELIKVIKAVFIKSELRDGYIQEIIEFRTMN